MNDIKKWRDEFLEYISGLNLPRDDYKRVVGYIDEVPAIEPEILACGEGELNAPGTNVGDMISRQAAINRATKEHDFFRGAVTVSDKARRDELLNVICWLGELPPAQPEIIRCRNCKFASGDSRICMKFGHSPIGELDFCAWAERRTDEPDR